VPANAVVALPAAEVDEVRLERADTQHQPGQCGGERVAVGGVERRPGGRGGRDRSAGDPVVDRERGVHRRQQGGVDLGQVGADRFERGPQRAAGARHVDAGEVDRVGRGQVVRGTAVPAGGPG